MHIPRRAVERTAAIALAEGMTRAQARGALREWLDGKVERHPDGDNIRIHGENLWIFAGDILLTCYPLPAEHRRAANRQRAKLTDQTPTP